MWGPMIIFIALSAILLPTMLLFHDMALRAYLSKPSGDMGDIHLLVFLESYAISFGAVMLVLIGFVKFFGHRKLVGPPEEGRSFESFVGRLRQMGYYARMDNGLIVIELNAWTKVLVDYQGSRHRQGMVRLHLTSNFVALMLLTIVALGELFFFNAYIAFGLVLLSVVVLGFVLMSTNRFILELRNLDAHEAASIEVDLRATPSAMIHDCLIEGKALSEENLMLAKKNSVSFLLKVWIHIIVWSNVAYVSIIYQTFWFSPNSTASGLSDQILLTTSMFLIIQTLAFLMLTFLLFYRYRKRTEVLRRWNRWFTNGLIAGGSSVINDNRLGLGLLMEATSEIPLWIARGRSRIISSRPSSTVFGLIAVNISSILTILVFNSAFNGTYERVVIWLPVTVVFTIISAIVFRRMRKKDSLAVSSLEKEWMARRDAAKQRLEDMFGGL